MTARGVGFLQTWVSKNVPLLPFTDEVLVRALTMKLKADVSAAGMTMKDLELDEAIAELFIKEAILFRAEPGEGSLGD
jgi:hypothetical protein